MPLPPTTVPLFVYGSLRPGMALWPMLRDHVVRSEPASVRGRLFWHSSMEYPVLTIGTGADASCHGELLLLRPGDEVNRVIVDEELLYGYDARWVRVRTRTGLEEAVVLVWNRDTDLGPEIVGGDYTIVATDLAQG